MMISATNLSLINFVDSVLEGESKIDDLDNWIEFWHQNQIDIELSTFLGLGDKDFVEFMKDPEHIKHVLKMRLH